MSKSLGNSPDPLELIGKYGADGLRFRFDADRADRRGYSFRRETDRGRPKLRHQTLECGAFPSDARSERAAEDRKSIVVHLCVEVLARFNETIDAIDGLIANINSDVAQRLYDFFWGDYCDRYVEAAKNEIFGTDEAKKLCTRRHGLRVVRRRYGYCIRSCRILLKNCVLLGFWRGFDSIRRAARKHGVGSHADLANEAATFSGHL